MNKEERESLFRAELAELLVKHGAEMDITDDGKPYGYHSPIVNIYMMPIWDDEGNEIAEFTSFRL